MAESGEACTELMVNPPSLGEGGGKGKSSAQGKVAEAPSLLVILNGRSSVDIGVPRNVLVLGCCKLLRFAVETGAGTVIAFATLVLRTWAIVASRTSRTVVARLHRLSVLMVT